MGLWNNRPLQRKVFQTALTPPQLLSWNSEGTASPLLPLAVFLSFCLMRILHFWAFPVLFLFVFLLMGVGVRADLCYSWPNQTSAVEGKGAVKSRSLIHIFFLVASCVAKQTAQNTYNGSECTQSSILATSLALATAVALMGAADLTGIAHPRCKLSLSAGKSRSLPISQAAASKLRFFFNRIVNCFGLAVRNSVVLQTNDVGSIGITPASVLPSLQRLVVYY